MCRPKSIAPSPCSPTLPVSVSAGSPIPLYFGLALILIRTEASSAYAQDMSEVVGNALLCAAFLAYGGYFDQGARAALCSQWKRT